MAVSVVCHKAGSFRVPGLREDSAILSTIFVTFQDPPSTLNWGYMVPNNGYLGPDRG